MPTISSAGRYVRHGSISFSSMLRIDIGSSMEDVIASDAARRERRNITDRILQRWQRDEYGDNYVLGRIQFFETRFIDAVNITGEAIVYRLLHENTTEPLEGRERDYINAYFNSYDYISDDTTPTELYAPVYSSQVRRSRGIGRTTLFEQSNNRSRTQRDPDDIPDDEVVKVIFPTINDQEKNEAGQQKPASAALPWEASAATKEDNSEPDTFMLKFNRWLRSVVYYI